MKRLSLLYDRYLRGVCLKRMGQTLIAFYSFITYVLLQVQVPAHIAARVAALATAAAAIVYLIIPKSKQALADNLMVEAGAHQAEAAAMAGKILTAVAAAKKEKPQ